MKSHTSNTIIVDTSRQIVVMMQPHSKLKPGAARKSRQAKASQRHGAPKDKGRQGASMGRVAESDLVGVAGAAVWGIKDQTKKKQNAGSIKGFSRLTARGLSEKIRPCCTMVIFSIILGF